MVLGLVMSKRKTAFGERLQRIMTERDLSQSDIARLIWGEINMPDGGAKNRQVVSKYLAGDVSPRMSTKRKLAAALDVPLGELDPMSKALERPGSGLRLEFVNRKEARLEVNLVLPKALAQQVIAILEDYAT